MKYNTSVTLKDNDRHLAEREAKYLKWIGIRIQNFSPLLFGADMLT